MAKKISLSEVSYVLGIVSIVMAFFEPFAGLVFGIIGFVQGKRADNGRAKKLNLIGIVLSVIFVIISIVALYYAVSQGANLFPTY